MKKFIIIIILVGLVMTVWLLVMKKSKTTTFYQPVKPSTEQISLKPMQIQSPAFGQNQNIPPKYTCDGDNVNPPLKFSDVPAEAKSLVLIMDDPDSPGGNWVHWLLWNINPSSLEIKEGTVLAEAVQGTTSFGQTGYGGPCPPSGQHRYVFKLYALDDKLNLPTRTVKSELESALSGHIITKAELVGVYQRQ